MELRTLGASGIVVSDLALGAMNFAMPGGPEDDRAIRMVHRALDAGINLMDTADVYTQGESERVVGLAIKDRRENAVLATKFGLPTGEDPTWVAVHPPGSNARLRIASAASAPTTSTWIRCTGPIIGPILRDPGRTV